MAAVLAGAICLAGLVLLLPKGPLLELSAWTPLPWIYFQVIVAAMTKGKRLTTQQSTETIQVGAWCRTYKLARTCRLPEIQPGRHFLHRTRPSTPMAGHAGAPHCFRHSKATPLPGADGAQAAARRRGIRNGGGSECRPGLTVGESGSGDHPRTSGLG